MSSGTDGGPSAAYRQSARPNGLAITALVLGVISMPGCFFLVPEIAALICGIIGLRQVRASGERGRGMAIAGIVLGGLSLLIFVGYIAFVIIFTATHAHHGS